MRWSSRSKSKSLTRTTYRGTDAMRSPRAHHLTRPAPGLAGVLSTTTPGRYAASRRRRRSSGSMCSVPLSGVVTRVNGERRASTDGLRIPVRVSKERSCQGHSHLIRPVVDHIEIVVALPDRFKQKIRIFRPANPVAVLASERGQTYQIPIQDVLAGTLQGQVSDGYSERVAGFNRLELVPAPSWYDLEQHPEDVPRRFISRCPTRHSGSRSRQRFDARVAITTHARPRSLTKPPVRATVPPF